jgi:hypothetical protein
MWAAGVVVGQHAANQAEGVGEPSLLQGLPQGYRGVAGAEFLVLDVRVGNQVVGRGWVGVEGNDFKAMAAPRTGQALPVQPKCEGSQVHALQGDRLGRDAQEPSLPVNAQVAELAFQLLQVGDQGSQQGNGRHALFKRQ